MDEYYPSEIHRLLKIGGNDRAADSFGAHDQNVPDLPVGDNHSHQEPTTPAHDAHAASSHTAEGPRNIHEATAPSKLRPFLIYPLIFIFAFMFFYLALNFSSIYAQVQGWFSKPQAQEILGPNTAEYNKWISNYFYAVGDAKLLEPTNDIDKDGLSNQDEFIMKTNPIVADSDGDGISDGIEILNSTNPWGNGAMTRQQKDLAGKLDVIIVNNRISGQIAANSNSTIVETASTLNYDLEKPGLLSIPKLKMQVALIWPKDPSTFDTDLTQGVIHYPGTALPGENGVIYVSGHSSDYFWKHDPMHDVFAKLNFLSAGDDIFITVYGKDGKTYNFRYQVTSAKTYKPDDQQQFFDTENRSLLNLSTCWPIGTSQDRLVVSAVAVPL